MRVIPLPPTTDLGTIADWLELRALTAPDRNSSRGDLETVLRAAPGFDVRDADAIEVLTVDAFRELQSRADAARAGYPFQVREDLTLELRAAAWRNQNAYLLCLCLTWFGYAGRPSAPARPVRIFEDLSVKAAGNYIGGPGIRFGFPRVASDLPTGFRAAIAEIVNVLQEGEGPRDRPTRSAKDEGLDVVAWRPHPDGRPGKLVLFGACASGARWRQKIDELQVGQFVDDWFKTRPCVEPIKAFFVPHRLRDDTAFTTLTRRGGVVFDRCRIAHWAPRLPALTRHGDGAAWARAQLQ